MGLAGIAVMGALLALQAAGLHYLYQQKLATDCPGPGVDGAAAAAAATGAAAAAWGNASCAATPGEGVKTPRLEVLHADARIFLYHNFLTEEECDHIIGLAAPSLARSGVVETSTGTSKVDKVRTSKGTFLRRGQDPVVSGIEERIARWTLMPVGNGEGLQVLKYETGQEYEGHFDYFFHKEGLDNGGNRYLTVLMYLNDVEEGGETCFPNIPLETENPAPEFSDCARKVLAAKPRKGAAVLFHSIQPTGELERRSLHTACPVIKGEKWSAPKWVHVGSYATGGQQAQRIEQVTQADQNYPGCKDLQDSCPNWARSGECEKNVVYMLGTKERPGQCVKACGKCADFFEFKATPRS